MVKNTTEVREPYAIKVEGGSVLRPEPDEQAEPVVFVPFAEVVLVKQISRVLVESDGMEYVCYQAEWNGNDGWLENIDLTNRSDFLLDYLREHRKFLAHYRTDNRGGSNPGYKLDEEIIFLDEANCAYARTEFLFDGADIYVFRAAYTLDFNKVHINLKSGEIVTVSYENRYHDSLPEPRERITTKRTPFTIVWSYIVGGFIRELTCKKLKIPAMFCMKALTNSSRKRKASSKR